ncbi:hypothetical protein L484_028038 [Morus notabilis]|uniref:Uncharacterized protein n=1 Tax=Morus notabilis TaxID=981085 RepID=W9SIC1_9ROSA|nr:uncharacterized protein LOC21410639 [Morus notabilis]EXC30859.1 hypothetical protein L484_028038 [Morus notabilis]
MNSPFSPSSLHLNPSSISQFPPYHQIQPRNSFTILHRRNHHLHCPLSLTSPSISHNLLRIRRSSIVETGPSDEGAIPLIDFEEDFVEKDWSFLDSGDLTSNQDYIQKVGRIIAAGQIEESSRVMVSATSEVFIDELVYSSPCNLLLVVHDSLFVLAGIKEKHDKVKCWQGELIYVPEKWGLLDVAFLYFLPALPFTLDHVFGALAKCCLPGARLVICHPQGREVLEQQRKQYPDVIISNLPEKVTLEKVAADHPFDLVEFVDDPEFYLAVLKFRDARD